MNETLAQLIVVTAAMVLGVGLAACGGDEDKAGLPAVSKTEGMSLREALATRRSVRSFKPDALTAEQITQLCWAAQGVSDERRGFRTAPSAGALYPLELYVVTADGVNRYQPDKHALVEHAPGDKREGLQAAALGQTFIGQAPATFIITAVVARTERKYGDRAERYVLMEVGHAGQNLLLQATALGLGAVPVGAFSDDRVGKILSLPANETPVYLIPVGVPK
ncbi:MAG: SagB/ThcOx family dehydrogenase [Planctomycetota bacterium]|jgi:SagB-type dehydrogenase family enzyme